MKRFGELGVRSKPMLEGRKVDINEIINKEIIVKSYRLEDSRYSKNKSGKCLYLQIEVDKESRVIFTGSDVLIDQIGQIGKQDFPFVTTISKPGKWFQFN